MVPGLRTPRSHAILLASLALLASSCSSFGHDRRAVSTTRHRPASVSVSSSPPTSTSSRTTESATTLKPRHWFGPFRVGAFRETVVDPTSGARVVTEVRYPAKGVAGTVSRVAVPARASGPFPLFVWNHGFDADPSYYESFLDRWAASGYVVAAPTFPGTSSDARPRPTYDSYVDQPREVQAVIDALIADARGSGVLAGLIDADLIAVGGHSLGAVTTEALTQESCCVDRRIVASVRISGGPEPFKGSVTLARPIPVLFVHGDDDATFPVEDSENAFARSTGRRFLLVLRGAPHTPFRTSFGDVIERVVVDFLDIVVKRISGASERLRRDTETRPTILTVS